MPSGMAAEMRALVATENVTDDELQLAATPYLPATATELQLLTAEAEHFGLAELAAQCRRRLSQLESERARAKMLRKTARMVSEMQAAAQQHEAALTTVKAEHSQAIE